ncbi:MAG TPA: hypothetical protein VI727_06850 [Candidatus Brocadiaceae bacterium]|nr:hypothetical protein [Candidatus Brocadiaceae bacterium]
MKKHLKSRSAKRILLALVFAFTLSGVYYYQTQPAYSDCTDCICGVTDQQCINYLVAHGYTNVSVISYIGCDRYCDTQNSYNTTVHVSNGRIVGYDDDPH